MNANLFDEMLSGFVEAKKYRAGRGQNYGSLEWLLNLLQ